MKLKYPTIQKQMIRSGVKNLKEFGYPHCDKENILTDLIYSKLFRSMLEDNLGQGFDAQINDLLEQLPK